MTCSQHFLRRLCRRMEELQFVADDPLYVAALRARDELQGMAEVVADQLLERPPGRDRHRRYAELQVRAGELQLPVNITGA